jgi:hypothetical protein
MACLNIVVPKTLPKKHQLADLTVSLIYPSQIRATKLFTRYYTKANKGK